MSTSGLRQKEKIPMMVVAFLIALAAVPSPYQQYFRLPGTPLSYSQSQPLYAAGPFQQEVPVQGGYQVPYATPAAALDLYWSYARMQQVHYVPAITLQGADLTPGKNITFVVRSPANLTQTAGTYEVNLYVFVIDPEGAVAATFPFGATVSMGSQSNELYFGANGVSYATNALQGGTEFTLRVPAGDQSVGTWRLFAVVTGGQAPAVAEANAQVGQPSSIQPATLFGWAGSWLGVYTLQATAVTSYRRNVLPRRKWLEENGFWFVAAALLLAFVLLAYLG